jgi:hypothetical protein
MGSIPVWRVENIFPPVGAHEPGYEEREEEEEGGEDGAEDDEEGVYHTVAWVVSGGNTPVLLDLRVGCIPAFPLEQI